MDENRKEQVALFRFSVIGSLISGELCHGDLKRRIRELADRRYSVPYSHKTHIAPGTIEDWLYDYRQKGFEGLKPKSRSDAGKLRHIDDRTGMEIIEYRRGAPQETAQAYHERPRREGKNPRPLPTLHRLPLSAFACSQSSTTGHRKGTEALLPPFPKRLLAGRRHARTLYPGA